MFYEICGGNKLYGELNVYGAKNVILPLLAASILPDFSIRIDNCRPLGDIETMCQILRSLGAEVVWKGDSVSVYSQGVSSFEIPSLLGSKIRASVLLLGALLGKYKTAKIPLPGGCAIGKRPINLHIDGLEKLGVKFEYVDGFLLADGRKMHGGVVEFPFVSVGATENLLLASVMTKGQTVLKNCSVEPEVVQLEHVLQNMGAKIDGIGTKNLTIQGVDLLRSTTAVAIGDRIVALTYLFAVAGTGGKVKVKGFDPNHCSVPLGLLKNAGCNILFDDGVIVDSSGVDGFGVVETAPYPSYPTDAQSLLLSLAAVGNGKTKIIEKVFENRLQHNVVQLQRMGANICLRNNVATISGGSLVGASVEANDLRGGAGLLLAGLFAKGITRVNNVSHVERGYFDIVSSLHQVGAEIKLTN